MNKYFVSVKGDNIVILLPPRNLTKEDALNLIAWIIVLANIDRAELEKAIEEINK
jgi:hypothetical protein